MSFVKLDSGIVLSSLWQEDHPTVRCWIAMLAMADRTGRVNASLPGFAGVARVTMNEAERAIARFKQPDPYSRTKDHDGRRIADHPDGGWTLLNYGKHRERQHDDGQREAKRRWAAKHRAEQAAATAAGDDAPAYADDFLRFWAAYPRRVGKGAAAKAWAKARPPMAAVLAAVKACAATDQWRKDGGQFIPHPATFLNQRRWEDDRGPVTVAPRTGGRDLAAWAAQQRAGGVPVADAPVTDADRTQPGEGA
jgi:hypothetical protein